MGPQGCGKGTQAEFICKRLCISHISSGDIFRKACLGDAFHEKELKSIMNSGSLIPDDIAICVVGEAMLKEKNGFVLEGFPRNVAQAEELEKFCAPDIVILIEIPDSESVSRLSSREQCRKCSAIYGAEKKPLNKGKCSACNGELYRRDDDNPCAIRKRLSIYHKDTEPIVRFYKKKEIMHRVDGTENTEDVKEDIWNVIKSHMSPM